MLRRPRRALGAALLALAACSEPDGPALVAALAWEHPDGRHGGLSGLELGPEGRALTAITDRAVLVTGRIERRGGVPVGVREVRHHPMTTPEGRALRGYSADSEGLAADPAGGVLVGFEGYHRVWRLWRDGAGAGRLPLPDAFAELPGNSGPEAVAIDAAGGVLAVLERPEGDAFPVRRWDGAAWRVVARLPRRGPMKAVGADMGPDGRLYLLERRLTPLGFRSRVRRFDLAGGEETLLDTPRGRHGNLEGLAVWRDAGGALRLTMVSDDNFLPFMRGEIVEYRLPPDPGGEADPPRPRSPPGRLDRPAPRG